LEGVDSNNNGVRDDVEIAIYSYAPKPEQEEVRQAMAQLAKGHQKAMLAGSREDVNETLEIQKETSRAVECLIKKSRDIVESKRQLASLARSGGQCQRAGKGVYRLQQDIQKRGRFNA
jgi:hypothetical protein